MTVQGPVKEQQPDGMSHRGRICGCGRRGLGKGAVKAERVCQLVFEVCRGCSEVFWRRGGGVLEARRRCFGGAAEVFWRRGGGVYVLHSWMGGVGCPRTALGAGSKELREARGPLMTPPRRCPHFGPAPPVGVVRLGGGRLSPRARTRFSTANRAPHNGGMSRRLNGPGPPAPVKVFWGRETGGAILR